MKKLSTMLLFWCSMICVQAQSIYSGQPNVIINGSHNVTIPCGNGSGCYQATARQTLTGFSTTYTVGSTPFVNFPVGGATPIAIQSDDLWSPVINIPFSFCFFGNNYNALLIGSNGVLTFDLTQAGFNCPWQLNTATTRLPLPNTALPKNAIMGPFQDIDPLLGGAISYITLGQSPRRVFVVSFQAVPHYNTDSCPGLATTSQIALYEGTNIIEVHMAQKDVCPNWNQGRAVEGIQNAAGTVGYGVAGRNNGQWGPITNDGQRFTPATNTAAETLIKWHAMGSNVVISTTDTANLCPTTSDTARYIVDVTYIQCDTSRHVTVSDTISVAILQSAGPDQYLSCPSVVDSVRMAGTGSAGTWVALPTNPGPVTIVSPNSPNTVIRGFTIVGTYYFIWSAGSCTDTAKVIVSAKPDAGPDLTNCVHDTVVMAAVGTGTWTALSTNPGATVILSPTDPHTIIDGFPLGGTYGFVWHFATCTDTAYVVIPFFAISATGDTSVCKNRATTLSVVATPATQGPFTYLWTDSSRVVSPTAATTAIKPLQITTDFVVKVTASNGCVLRDTVRVDLKGSTPRITLSASNNNVCPGDVIYLNSTVVVENLVSCGTVDTCPDNSLLTIASVGTNNASTSLTTPYSGTYGRAKAQYLFTAAELAAAGLSSGAITDIAFFVNAVNSTAPYDSFTVSMGCTDQTTLSGQFLNTLIEVAPAAQVIPTTGWSPHPFTHYYNWDGVSNLVIQICYTRSASDNNDVVASTTTAANSVAYSQSFSTTGANGCSLLFPTFSRIRPNVRFGNCAPNVLHYTWSPPTLYCDSCNFTQVSVTKDSTYHLTVDDNGCSNDTFIRVTINPYLPINVTPVDTTLCTADTVQLNIVQLNPAPSACLQTYTVTSIPFASIAGTATNIRTSAFSPSTDDGTAGPFNIGFPFTFYCSTFNQFWVNANAWISLTNPLPATTFGNLYNAQTFPPAAANNNPLNEIALMVGDYEVLNNNDVSYFTTGTAPNRIAVIKYNNLSEIFGFGSTTGEIHLYETSGVVEIMIQQSDASDDPHTTGVKKGTGVGIAAPGHNNQFYTVTTSEGWRFTPPLGPSTLITHVQWTPNGGTLSNDTIINPYAYPPAPQYVADVDILINKFTNPEVCHLRDTAIIRSGTFPHTVTATPSLICAGANTQLQFSSSVPVASYNWTGPVSDPSISNPVGIVNDTTQFFVRATNVAGCSVTDSVTVYTYPYPQISLGADRTICYTDSVTLSAPGTYSSFQWYVPGTAAPVATTPTLTAHPLSSYVLRLQDATTGCYFYTDTITIDSFAHPVLHVSANGPLGFCAGGNVVLSADQGLNNYKWSPTNTTNIDLPVTTMDNYSYTATDGNGCYRYSDTAHVTINSHTAISFSPPVVAICSGDTARVVALTNPVGVPINWSYNNTIVSLDDTLVTIVPGTYYAYTNVGCADTLALVINTATSPTVDLGPTVSECSCNPSILITPVVTPATVTYIWSDGSTGTTYTVDTTGKNVYTVTVTTADGCTATAGKTVNVLCFRVHPYAEHDSVFAGGTITLTDTPALAGTVYHWYPSDSLKNPTASSTTGTASGGTADTFYLAATDAATGCADTGFVVINIINQGGFRMATGFTPNGDGKNDRMYPIILEGTEVKVFRVYNRWGQLVYDNPKAPGWDGAYGGNAQATDTYTYFVTVEFPDPADASKKIKQSIEGSFQLFR